MLALGLTENSPFKVAECFRLAARSLSGELKTANAPIDAMGALSNWAWYNRALFRSGINMESWVIGSLLDSSKYSFEHTRDTPEVHSQVVQTTHGKRLLRHEEQAPF